MGGMGQKVNQFLLAKGVILASNRAKEAGWGSYFGERGDEYGSNIQYIYIYTLSGVFYLIRGRVRGGPRVRESTGM